MWASRLFFCRSSTPVPALLSVSKSAFKPFPQLKYFTIQTPRTWNLFKNPSIFKHHQLNFNLLTKNSTTAAVKHPTVNVEKSIGLWLLICCGTVYGAIIIGGYTRLTESGLSMVTWRFSPETYPSNDEEWIAEFKKYQEYPEYKLLKRNMTLEEFKKIWITEYIHRLWGRVVGLIFMVPAISFWAKGYFQKAMKTRVVVLGSLIGCQGLLGWYMVQSGLEDRFHQQSDVPRVSQYRLAAHLGLAIILYSGMFMTTLKVLMPYKTIPHSALNKVKKLRIMAYSSKGLAFLTALSGAFVAGLDAGLVYNSFPKMGDKWIPDDILSLYPKIKNFTENPTTVQFDHRILGITTLLTTGATWFYSRKVPLTRQARKAATLLLLASLLQVTLGITTLVHHVPKEIAMAHQSGSILLLTVALWLCHVLRFFKYIPK